VSGILLIKTGATLGPIIPQHGDFEDWFAAGLGVPSVRLVEVYRRQPLPDPASLAGRVAGIVISGSAAMVSEREDWSELTAGWLQRAVATGVPVLGVCYGHQLLAHALGGQVGPNPRGRQIGTVRARRLPAALDDPLLDFLPPEFMAQTSHSEIVLRPPPGARRLAVGPKDEHFALRFSENAWGVQFHPEFSAPVMGEYIRLRAGALRSEGLHPAVLERAVEDTPLARAVLLRFREVALARSPLMDGERPARAGADGPA